MKNFLLKVGFRISKEVLSYLPLTWAVGLGAFTGRLASYFLPKEQLIADVQLRWALPELQRSVSTTNTFRQTLAHIGRATAETFHITELISNTTENIFPPLAQIVNERKGALILSGHIGCFELLAAYHRRHGANFVVIGRSPNYPFLIDAVSEIRKGYDVPTLWRENNSSALTLLRTFRSETSIAVLIDQDADLENIYVPFFGLPAAYPVGLIRMALKLQRPIFTSYIVRVGPLEHRIYSEEIICPQGQDSENYVLSEFSKRLEALVYQYPHQWPWWHRRWRRQADRESSGPTLRSSKEYVAWLEDNIRKRDSSR